MAKKTRTMAATLKDAKKLFKKAPRARTSTIDATLASAPAGFKQKKKPTKTRTMAETLKAAAPAPKKTKKVAKKAAAKSKASKSKKGGKGGKGK